MSKLIIAILTGLLGLILGINISSEPQVINPVIEPPSFSLQNKDFSNDISSLQTEIKHLSSLIQNETQKNEESRKEIAILNQQVKQLSAVKNTDSQNDSHTSTISTLTEDLTTKPQNIIEKPQTTQEILASIGIDLVTAESIAQRNEKREMDQLYIRNQAVREGWFGTEKYFKKSRELEQNTNIILEELGENKYDEYLYTSGKFNRIKVSSILSASPAEAAGILPNDIILSYDNKRIFNWSDLTTMTAEGKANELVEVSVLRENMESKFFIPRGPMGIRLESLRVKP